MYAFDFEKFLKENQEHKVHDLVSQLREVQRTHGSRDAYTLFANRVGLHALPIYNQDYYGEALNYNLALLTAYVNPQEAALLMDRSVALPSDGDQQLFTDYLARALELSRQQKKATSRFAPLHRPLMLLTSLQKSGSASLSQSLAQATGVPIMRLSIGRKVCALVPHWVHCASKGGLTTHDHFPASQHNLDTLKQQGVTRLCVQLRDPRAAVYSLFHMKLKHKAAGFREDNFHEILWDFYPRYVAWIAGWLRAAKENPWLSIHWITYPEYRANPEKTVFELLRFFRVPIYWRLRARKNISISNANFNKGDDEAWREHTPLSVQQDMWKEIPPEVVDFLKLKP